MVVEEIDLHSQPLLEKWRFFNISKYAGPVKVFALKEFHNFAHTITAAQVHCAPSTGYLLRSVICLQPMARPLAFMLRWRSPPNILSVNSPVWLSNVAMLCCFACRSTPTIFISASFARAFLGWHRKVYSGVARRRTYVISYPKIEEQDPSIGSTNWADAGGMTSSPAHLSHSCSSRSVLFFGWEGL